MLSSLAQKFLCICATSVASERTFSTGGNIVTSKRNCLKPHVVDQLVFLNQARAWFLEIDPVWMSVCVFACVCVRPRGY